MRTVSIMLNRIDVLRTLDVSGEVHGVCFERVQTKYVANTVSIVDENSTFGKETA